MTKNLIVITLGKRSPTRDAGSLKVSGVSENAVIINDRAVETVDISSYQFFTGILYIS